MENSPSQLAFVGDLCPSGVYSSDPTQLTRSLGELRQAAGPQAVLFFNLECSFVEDGVGTDTQANAAALRALATIKPAVANLSNNHHFDSGVSGSQRIRDILQDIGIPHVGLHSAERPAFDAISVGSMQVACVCRTARGTHPDSYGPEDARILPLDHDEIVSTCRTLVGRYDACIACLHWGAEYYLRPSPLQRHLVDTLVSIGVDIVWGQHAHVLQERYWQGDSLVMLNMGNAIFGQLSQDRWPKVSRAASMVGWRVGEVERSFFEGRYDAGITGNLLAVQRAVPLTRRAPRVRIWQMAVLGWFLYRVYMEIYVFGRRFIFKAFRARVLKSTPRQQVTALTGADHGGRGVSAVVRERVRRIFAIWEDE